MPTDLEPSYVTVQEMRDEGVPSSVADEFLTKRIALASRFVEMATGRFFAPRALVFRLDGDNGRYIDFSQPIISLTEVSDRGETLYDEDLFIIYNRHLQGFLTPDDRDMPRLELSSGRFYSGRQNVWVSGVFGYTDPDGTPEGKTPDLIKHVTALLVVRELTKIGNAGARFDALNAHRLTMERTRDQQYQLEPRAAQAQGVYFTGDPEIDRVLVQYRRPPVFTGV